jgi:activator of 2-hydroxyglutaryl-CoA dehydratase
LSKETKLLFTDAVLPGGHALVFERFFRVGIEKDITLTGGVAKNVAMCDRLKQKIGFEPLLMPEPLISGALGAAVIAQQRLLAKQKLSDS